MGLLGGELEGGGDGLFDVVLRRMRRFCDISLV